MSFLSNLVSVATGGLADQVVGLVKSYFPPDMPPEKKAELQIAIERIGMEREKNANDAAREAEASLNERIREYEGTASDLKSIPVLGPAMIFLRGAQRPLIGYATIWLDYNVFSHTWTLEAGAQESSFWLINLLVLGFLFGERAAKNVMPFVSEMLRAKAGAK